MTRKLTLLAMVVAASVFSLVAVALPTGVTPVLAAVSSTVITVTVTNDELNFDGDCSLREAIRAANLDVVVSGCPAGSGADVIVLGAATYTLSIAGAGENGGLTGDLDITSTLTIRGIGPSSTTIDGNGATTNDRVFQIFNSAGVVTISGVTVTDGRPAADDGGGIHNQSGSVVLINSTVSNNSSATLNAGGVYNQGTMQIISSTIASNTADGGAGAIRNNGIMTITASTIRDNTASNHRGGGIINESGRTLFIFTSTVRNNHSAPSSNSEGGGIYNNGGRLTIQASTIRDNSANDSGGIYNNGLLTVTASAILSNTAISAGGMRNAGSAAATLVNSTVGHNRANPGGAGGIANGSAGSVLNLYNVTIAANVSTNGGGLHNGGGGTVNVRNSILANNVNAAAPDCLGTINSLGYNLIESTTGCTFTNDNDITGLDPQFSAPSAKDNGGPTLSFALLGASPAVDGARPTGCVGPDALTLTRDQRGFIRPIDGGVGGMRCDIGSIEFNSVAPVDLVVSKTGPAYVTLPATATNAFSYVVRITNTSGVTSTGGLVTDTLPAGYVIDTFNNLPIGTPFCQPPAATNIAVCGFGGLNPLSTRAITVTAHLSGATPTCGSILVNNVVMASIGDTNPANNSASAQSVIGCPDIAIAKLGPSLIVSPSTTAGAVQYRLTVTNAGNMPLSNIIVTDTLPAGIQYNSSLGVACAGTPAVPVCTVPNLAIGATSVFTLNAALIAFPACGALLNNQVLARPIEGDLNPANNNASSQGMFLCKLLFLPVVLR